MEVTLIDSMGNDNSVVNAARVSFNKTADQFTDEQNEKLIKYLAKHEHYSPFGHCFVSFHVKAPVFVRSQLVKHEYLRINEVSRRYVDSKPEFYDPIIWRGRALDKKQGSEGTTTVSSMEYVFACYKAIEMYEDLLAKGVAPEQARMVLPQSMYTEWYWSGSLDAFANMCKLRCKPDTQEETRVIANQVSKIMSNLYPISWGALTNE